jgi:hypothetical protein
MLDDTNTPVEETVETKVQEQAPQPETTEKTPEPEEKINWRQIRERIEQTERKNFELQKALESQQKPPQQEPDEQYDFDDENLVEGKHVKKYISKLSKELKETKKQIAEFNAKNALTTAEIRLNSLEGFRDLVTDANLEKLAKLHPEDYASAMANPDIYARGKTAYNMIKNYGIDDKYKAVDQKISENKTKPRSSANAAPQASNTPLARVGDYDRRVMSEERRTQVLAQLEELKKQR